MPGNCAVYIPFDKMKRAWEELYANNGKNMMLLNDGVKYVPSASTSVEMQLNENKRTNSEQIAAIFGLSTEIISGTADTQTYMSAVRTAVIPVVEAYQAALNKSLLRESEKGRLYFTLDTTELLKGNTLSRYQAYAIGLKNNFLQIDEVRYLEDKEPIGFNYVKLGLQDVLLDPKTGAVYTPNTNQTALVGRLTNSNKSGIMESDETRGKDNWIKGEHGYFAGSTGGNHGHGGKQGGKPVMQKGGGSSGSAKKDLTNEKERDIMNKDKECIIPNKKVNEFFLKEGAKHSGEFFSVGYTPSDGERLKSDIAGNFSYSKAVEKKMVDGSERFNVYMNLGVTKIKRFRTVWQKDEPDSIPRIITAYRKD